MEKTSELVSIIVPVYNAGAYIEETISMVKKQTCENWELLLVDDCSSDDSRQKICACMEHKDDRIRLIEKERNEGAARARNTGIEAAKGRYIAFLDADDLWMEDKLEKELAFMKEKQAAFVFTAYEFGDEEGKPTGKVVHVPPSLTYDKALSRTVIFTTTVLLDTEKTGHDLIKMPEVKSEDTATWWKILKNGYTAYGLDQVLAIYRRPAKSLSSNKLEAVRRIWNLYRRQEQLPVLYSIYNLIFWALRATLRRI
ncbi:MAG: glycosyltransferase family 2 protein [Bacillota bacterium]|nr:glycosyltransferase family 2 protein [Bacillota bacterium]